MNAKQYPTTLILLTALALGASSCGKKQGGMPPQRPVTVKLTTANKVDTPIVVAAYGTLLDRETVDIVPQVSGLLQEILFQEGAVVTNGQPLFRIDPRDYQARVQQAEGMLSVDQAALELARSTLARNQPLLEKRLIPTDTFDAIKTKVATLEAQLKMDTATLEQARLSLTRCVITAPITGLTSKRYADAGNLVTAGMTRLTNIRSHNPLRLECSVSEQHLPALRGAMAEGSVTVSVTPQGDTNSYPGTLTFIDNAVNTAAGTVLLRGDVPNPARKLWAGQFVDIRIITSIERDAVLVPESAVLFGKNGPYLFAIDKDSKAELRPVVIGLRHENQLRIISGVTAGETVVALGQFMLRPGATVMDPSRAPAPSTSAEKGK